MKTCVVSANPFSQESSTGLLLHSLFSKWPSADLSQVFFPIAAYVEPDFSHCKTFRQIEFNGRASAVPPSRGVEQVQHNPGRRSFRALIGRARQRTVVWRLLRPFQELWYSRFGSILQSQLKILQPDLVFALVGNYCLNKIIFEACQALSIPTYTFVTDDFVESLYDQSPSSWMFKKAADRCLRDIIETSVGCAGISPLMAETYQERYGGEWDWFATLVDSRAFSSESLDSNPEEFVYAGNLELERWQVLARVAKACSLIREQGRYNPRLTIYSSKGQIEAYRENVQIADICRFREWVPQSELSRVLSAAGTLLHVESFNPALAAYTKLSFSTKLSQYMMAGNSILFVGPETCGSSIMLNRVGAGHTIASEDPKMLAASIAGFLNNPSLRLSHAESGHLWAMKWLDRETGSHRFRDRLLNCVEKRKDIYV